MANSREFEKSTHTHTHILAITKLPFPWLLRPLRWKQKSNAGIRVHSAKIHARLRSHSWRKRERERERDRGREGGGRATVIAAIEQLSYRMIDDSIVRPFPCPLPRFRASGIQKAGRHFENGRNYGKFGPGRSIDPRDFIPCNISLSLSLSRVSERTSFALSLSLSLFLATVLAEENIS